MLKMAQRIDARGGGHLDLTYEANQTNVSIRTSETVALTASLRFPVEDFDKLVEEYMYLRQYTNGRRAR